MSRVVIFYEGISDKTFIRKVVDRIPNLQGVNILYYEYSEESNEEVSDFIQRVHNEMNEASEQVQTTYTRDYVFTGDADFQNHGLSINIASINQRKNEIQVLYSPRLPKIVIVIEEIESWYVAGLDQQTCNSLSFPFVQNPDTYTKEQFKEDSLVLDESVIIARKLILANYNFEFAKRSASFDYFIDTLHSI